MCEKTCAGGIYTRREVETTLSEEHKRLQGYAYQWGGFGGPSPQAIYSIILPWAYQL